MLWTKNGQERRGIGRLASGLLLAGSILSGSVLGAQEDGAPPEKKWANAVERLAQPLIDRRVVPSLVIGFYDRGEIEIYGLGRWSKDDPTPPNGRTIYEIGSVTKVLTAVLLAEADRRGEVALEDSLGKWLPEGVSEPRFEEKSITLEDLATHRSALPRIPPGIPSFDLTDPYAEFTRDRLYEFLGAHELTRAPGVEYEYSNLAVGLLGQMLSDRAGQSYPELLEERIARPLGLVDTTVTRSAEQAKRAAAPHRDRLAMRPWQFGALCGCGGVRSTVEDLLRFIDATARGTNSTVAASPQRAGLPEQIDAGLTASLKKVTETVHPGMALGWHVAGDRSTIHHMGQTGGFSAGVLFHPRIGKGVVVLANGATSHVDRLAEKLIQTMFGMPVAEPEYPDEIEVGEKALARVVGTYVCPFFEIEVTVREGALFAQLTDQLAYRVYPRRVGEGVRYFYRDLPAELEFRFDESKEEESKEPSDAEAAAATQVVLHQGGREFICERR